MKDSEMRKQAQLLLIKYDAKLFAAITQNKTPMVSYYYAKISAIFDLIGRTKQNKALTPAWLKWNLFTRDLKEEEFYGEEMLT
jgi:hypothetical protein